MAPRLIEEILALAQASSNLADGAPRCRARSLAAGHNEDACDASVAVGNGSSR